MTHHRVLMTAAGILLLSGCTALREPVPVEALPAIAEPRAHYQVWSHGSPRILIALRTTADTLSGVPYWKPPACDSCRVAISRSAVDSVRITALDPNKSLLAAIIITPLVVLMMAFRGMGGPGS